MPVVDRVETPPPSVPAAARDATADARADGEVRMGYGPCTVPGCFCQAYAQDYGGGTTLCTNCAHDYSMHT